MKHQHTVKSKKSTKSLHPTMDSDLRTLKFMSLFNASELSCDHNATIETEEGEEGGEGRGGWGGLHQVIPLFGHANDLAC